MVKCPLEIWIFLSDSLGDHFFDCLVGGSDQIDTVLLTAGDASGRSGGSDHVTCLLGHRDEKVMDFVEIYVCHDGRSQRQTWEYQKLEWA